MMGRNMAFSHDTIQIKDQFFKGWLDEVYLFDTALEPQQIRSLMKDNRLN